MNSKESQKFKVAIVEARKPEYPSFAPYHPSEYYPEYPFGPNYISSEPNYVYQGLRELFLLLDYDKDNFGSKYWNPLKGIIKPGMTVVIKPNFVLSRHEEGKDIYSIITHPSLLRAIVDYCWIALQGEGEIIIADAPQYNCDFEELMKVTKLREVMNFINNFNGPKLKILDLRDYWSQRFHFYSCLKKLPGDPNGKILINLRDQSAFYNFQNPQKLYGATFWRQETISHHSGEKQEYEISGTILKADVLISVPKLKVHKKVGVTMNIKGLVGTCPNKNLLVHYTLGGPDEGGDQYPPNVFSKKEKFLIKFERWMYDTFLAKKSLIWEIPHRFIYGFLYLKIFTHLGLGIPYEKQILDRGNWYGNDSAWRMSVDLAKIIHFADKNGVIQNSFQRRFFSLVDGIIGGENNGPLLPDPKKAGLLIGGENFLAVDIVSTRLMGFDPLKLKTFSYLLNSKPPIGPTSLKEIYITTNNEKFENILFNKSDKLLNFMPHPGWVGHIEV